MKKRSATFRIADRERVYELVVYITHKKRELVVLEVLPQVLQALWAEGVTLSDDEERELSHLQTVIRHLREEKSGKKT